MALSLELPSATKEKKRLALYLDTGLFEHLNGLAKERGVSVNKIMGYFIQLGLVEYEKGMAEK